MLKLYSLSEVSQNKLLNICGRFSRYFSEVCVLNSNFYKNQPYSDFQLLAGFGSVDSFVCKRNNNSSVFDELSAFKKRYSSKIFGFLAYDLKNSIENLESNNLDEINFPNCFFFVPKILIELNKKGGIDIFVYNKEYTDLGDLFVKMLDDNDFDNFESIAEKPFIQTRFSKNEYINSVEKIKQHIKFGDVYELNFCQEFYSQHIEIDPFKTYLKLNSKSEMPFSAYFKLDDKFLLCASPERFMKKIGSKILSQPIKGTSQRFENHDEDEKSKLELQKDTKERAENIMIVDLVRNDLSKTAISNSVKVEELCQVYSFPKVHQMISTVVSELDLDYSWVDVIKTCFPMGSMTGAPKIRAMQLIEEFEKTKRGLYSGSVGYVSEENDFDFNVVIRSIQYNQTNQTLSFITGSAITILSDPEKEYDECLLKAEAIFETLG